MDHSPDYYESETIVDNDVDGYLDTVGVENDGGDLLGSRLVDGDGDGHLDTPTSLATMRRCQSSRRISKILIGARCEVWSRLSPRALYR